MIYITIVSLWILLNICHLASVTVAVLGAHWQKHRYVLCDLIRFNIGKHSNVCSATHINSCANMYKIIDNSDRAEKI